MINSQTINPKYVILNLHRTRVGTLFMFLAMLLLAGQIQALDPPHDVSESIDCASCHTFHDAPGGALTLVKGNSNLCQSCHVVGGSASNKAMSENDQARPGLALGVGKNGGGTSHRWDTGPQGRVDAENTNTSTGTVSSGGVYTGPNIQTFVVTITTPGDVGVAEFSWDKVLKAGGVVTETVHDEFNSISYSGNNGTQNWSVGWNENDNLGGGNSGGNIRVVSSGNCASGNCLQVRADNSGDSIYRQANLAGATTATLTYTYENILVGNDEVLVEVYDGQGWNDLKTYFGSSTGSGSETFDISSSIASNTRVRFRVTLADRNEYIWFDNVQIEYTVPKTGGGGGGGSPDGTGVTGADVALSNGLTLIFEDGVSSPSFEAGDSWNVYVIADVSPPSGTEMAARLENGGIMCSTCHDQHSQKYRPFDPLAPNWTGPGTGNGRHVLRADNDLGQICVECHAARHVTESWMGSHPVGIGIPQTNDYQNPSSLPLDSAGNISCLTCHDMHNNPTDDGLLLRISDYRTLCSECHTLAGAAASHFDTNNGALWPGGRRGSSFPAVSNAARKGSCDNCHYPHGWPDSVDPILDNPALTVEFEEEQCFTCHVGNPDATDLLTEFQKSSSHPMGLGAALHDPRETEVVNGINRHVECMDCHNPHEATASVSVPGPSTARRLTVGPMEGVQGVTAAGAGITVATYEYEVCFRCHADSTGKPAAVIQRQFPETNVRNEFDGTAVSFHPVTTTGAGSNVPSLINGWQTNSIMSCTNCHNNDSGPATGGNGPNGPHGSIWPSLLQKRFETTDPTVYSAASYDLCFDCHSSSNILNDNNSSFADHDKHIRAVETSCNVCHDPHASGNPRLINFDTSVVTPQEGKIEFIWNGPGSGSCQLRCHGKEHSPKSYP